MKLRGVILAGLLALSVNGCSSGDGPDAAIEEGKRLFADAGCRFCHTLADADASATKGPNLDATQPDFEAVRDQVEAGGNGMPAFGDRFSAEQIEAIAGYVSSAATGSLSAATAFEPDDTELADCDGVEEVECYGQAFANLSYEQGPRQALGLLGRRAATDGDLAAVCHRVGHSMGAAALARFDDDVGEAFAQGSAVCSSGYYHGILEHSFAGVDDDELGETAAGLCSGGPLTNDAFLAFQCRHGLGHGLMIETGYDLPLALDSCDALGSGTAQACHDGVFMENFSSSYGVTSEWLHEDDLIYPCNDVDEERKYSCYIIVTGRMFDVLGSWRRTAEACRDSEPEWEYVCFRSFGRDAISRNAYDQDVARRLCRLTGEMEGECVLSVALHIANEEADLEGAGRFCRETPAPLRLHCYAGVGSTALVLLPDLEQRTKACERITSELREMLACSSATIPA